MSVADNLARIRDCIADRPIKLVAISKYVTPSHIAEAFEHGVTDFGESKVLDALKKQDELKATVGEKISWHFVGHLQTNKVSKAVGRFSLIHSIDSLKLAGHVSAAALSKNIVQPVLLQVNVAQDESKFGFDQDELLRDFQEIIRLPGISVRGLMTIAPKTNDATIWHNCFEGLQLLRNRLEELYGVELAELSMGMSADYKEAIACGATIIRLGRALFE